MRRKIAFGAGGGGRIPKTSCYTWPHKGLCCQVTSWKSREQQTAQNAGQAHIFFSRSSCFFFSFFTRLLALMTFLSSGAISPAILRSASAWATATSLSLRRCSARATKAHVTHLVVLLRLLARRRPSKECLEVLVVDLERLGAVLCHELPVLHLARAHRDVVVEPEHRACFSSSAARANRESVYISYDSFAALRSSICSGDKSKNFVQCLFATGR